jgi:hypothetical protein
MAIPLTAVALEAYMRHTIEEIFTATYDEHHRPLATGWFESYYIIKKNHKYQVWLCGQSRKKLVAKNITHRREALAIIKLLTSVKEQS